ncbi:MAG: hypothetical protein B7Z53_02040 [Rhodospirillales bacterium 12-71-4]|nr:MAG: hypothetical protein B7Z53_02040 [Rhodospirillales bacterium 12-71-4]
MERWVRDRPDGSRLELRRAPLPGGGYVTLYTPVRDPDGGPALSLAEAFRAEWRGRLPRLTAAAADGDTPGARQVAHALRGIAGNAGWPAVAGVLAAVEAAAEAGDVTELRLLTALLPVEPPSTV